jgi:hypothetical protein
LSECRPASERLSERERTLILAILATVSQPSGLVLNSTYAPVPNNRLCRGAALGELGNVAPRPRFQRVNIRGWSSRLNGESKLSEHPNGLEGAP